MEDAIKKVIKLDKDVEEYKVLKQMEIKERKEGLSKKIELMWIDVEEELKTFKSKVQEDYEKNIKANKEKIDKEKIEKITNVKNKYKDKKETIVEDAIKTILNPFKGE
ncbi:hypothetical protein K144313037_21010 [Clostridium tetani]|uniref:Uncharacterized protein n=1 Tax=Clostridium tetani TaxID=1513 RepID=A0A4Q0VBN8_CLOTA|nr:hypothetical protein [Clostridium tetani]AVP53897.1 hypothetical protein C3B72_01710 [Clostridium tetani]KGI45116.1 hypothetical protein KY55_00285 [Clostridium tetani]RXI48943.1 hypothetical protein DP130_05900 [Clostridium tetani]RXI53605.1 hypothetical protein DP122_07180 [Clostridium tetani]RXI55607.1 hypothetical protein DP124_01680 [Clostridium tetani]